MAEVKFEQAGPVEIFCSIHPRMSGVILVLQNPFFTKPAADGGFTLRGVPPGEIPEATGLELELTEVFDVDAELFLPAHDGFPVDFEFLGDAVVGPAEGTQFDEFVFGRVVVHMFVEGKRKP